jgi:hypothetical protein
LIREVQGAQDRGLQTVNALFTLSSATLPFIEDMMSTCGDVDWGQMVFSPFASVRNHGSLLVEEISLRSMLLTLSRNPSFVNNTKTKLLLGSDIGRSEGLTTEQVIKLVGDYGLAQKAILIRHDPLLLGYLRLSYDGFVMTPYQSLHPADYRLVASQLDHYGSLDEAYLLLRAS